MTASGLLRRITMLKMLIANGLTPVVSSVRRASLTTWASGRKASHPCWLDFRMLLLPEPQLQGPNLGRDREGLWFVNGNSVVIQCTEVSANARGWTQYGVILASVLNPWANVVMMAATRLGNEDRPQAICRQQVCVNVNWPTCRQIQRQRGPPPRVRLEELGDEAARELLGAQIATADSFCACALNVQTRLCQGLPCQPWCSRLGRRLHLTLRWP